MAAFEGKDFVSPEAMKETKFSAKALRESGFSLGALKAACFDATDLRNADYTSLELRCVGFDAAVRTQLFSRVGRRCQYHSPSHVYYVLPPAISNAVTLRV